MKSERACCKTRILDKLTQKLHQETGISLYNSGISQSRRDFLKRTLAYGSTVAFAIAAVERAVNGIIPSLVPESLDYEIRREVWNRLNILPSVGASSKIVIKVPVATKIPDPNNPFAEGMWNDATRVGFHWWFRHLPPNPNCYIYIKLTPDDTNPCLFFFTDALFATNSSEDFSPAYCFNIKEDAPINWNYNPDDFYFGRATKPFVNPPKYGRILDSKYGTELEKEEGGGSINPEGEGGFVFKCDFETSENSNQEHYKAYAEIPIKPLLKYPNPKDPSRMGFNADAEQGGAFGGSPDVIWSAVTDWNLSNPNWPELVLTDIKIPDLSWADLLMIAALGFTGWQLYSRRKTQEP